MTGGARNAPPDRAAPGGIQHFDFLDALRGIAVLGVVALHSGQNFHVPLLGKEITYGRFGVQLFYVVSAFSLCLSLDQRSRNERRPLLNYALRRFFRIAPLFYFAILVYLVKPFVLPDAAAPVRETIDWSMKLWHVAATVLFVNGWHYQSINLVVPGCWSVAVESNFYLVLPLLLAFSRSLKRAGILFGLALAFSIVFRKVIYLLFAPGVPFAGFGNFAAMSLPSQLPVFVLGIVMFRVFRLRQAAGLDSKPRWMAATIIGLSLAVAAEVLAPPILDKVISDPVRNAVIFVFLGLLLAQRPLGFFVNRFTILLGRISYSVYLFHFVALQLVIWASQTWYEPHGGQRPGFVLAFPVVLAIAAAISTLTYRLIEVPGQRVGKRLIQRLEERESLRLQPQVVATDEAT